MMCFLNPYVNAFEYKYRVAQRKRTTAKWSKNRIKSY